MGCINSSATKVSASLNSVVAADKGKIFKLNLRIQVKNKTKRRLRHLLIKRMSQNLRFRLGRERKMKLII